jgi:hypothetical protein
MPLRLLPLGTFLFLESFFRAFFVFSKKALESSQAGSAQEEGWQA